MPDTDHAATTRAIPSRVAAFAKVQPAIMQGFHAMHRAMGADGAIDAKTKELMALAVSIATHCDDCIAAHVQGALKKGATREEIAETCGVAVVMGGGPALMYATHAMQALDQLTGE